jgi:outer membrane receptor protein involved in Fe transport
MIRITRAFKPLLLMLCVLASRSQASPLEGKAPTYTVLEEYVVSSLIEQDASILPNDHPFSSVYGYETGILDTPRNVTVISKTQLEAISLKDVRDFTKLTTSSYTGSNFGSPTTPSIRGQAADTLVNGMRKGLSNNGNGMPLNTNSIESVNILKGPPSVMVGVSQYVGGYVDLITKRPSGNNEGRLELTIDSEGMRKAMLDQNIVISDTASLRISLTGEDSTDYYWDDYYRQTAAIYAAFEWVPNEHYRLELMAEYFNANFTENWGINRPTQDLIDHNLYVTNTGSFSGFYDSITTTGTTTINRTARLHGEGDGSNGNYLSLQAIQSFYPNPDVSIINNSLFQYRDRDIYSSYAYNEALRDNIRFENRTELSRSIDLLGFEHSFNLGLAGSYQDVWATNDYYHEPANAWDLANQTYADISVSDGSVFLDPSISNFLNAVPVYSESAQGQLSYRPGSTSSSYFFPNIGADYNTNGTDDGVPDGLPDGVYVSGNQDSNDSQITGLGIFLQDDIKLNPRFNLLLGGRLDYVHVKTVDPLYDDMMRYMSDYFSAAELEAAGVQRGEDSHQDFVPNYNIGLIYKLSPSQRLYLNYNYSESIPTDLGGGIALPESGELDHDSFNTQSQLLEFGYKGTFWEDSLYYNANLFQQERVEPQSIGADQEIELWGLETELHYQPSEDFYFIIGYSYIESVTRNAVVASRVPISSVASTGGVYNYSTFYGFSGYDAKTPGMPSHILNGLVAYQFSEHWTSTLGFLVTSKMDLGFNVPGQYTYNSAGDPTGEALESAEIPWQYSIDFGIKYETERWAIELQILNVTDEENWGTVNGIYGNDSVFAELPRRYELTVSLKW